MSVFAIIGTANHYPIQKAITALSGASHYLFAPNACFVSDSGSTKDVWDKLVITQGNGDILGVVV